MTDVMNNKFNNTAPTFRIHPSKPIYERLSERKNILRITIPK
jgi:hypothetical protein